MNEFIRVGLPALFTSAVRLAVQSKLIEVETGRLGNANRSDELSHTRPGPEVPTSNRNHALSIAITTIICSTSSPPIFCDQDFGLAFASTI